ncbi:uncharacterized protein LOC135368060 isoform X1 [Ornithodoros turicata]|uniref:uncharacterized protein LOC135368060 isoform X1 n=1 Tax=Ornithodoros turicata TaxID=34597 RepID=UPI003138D5FC
MLKDKDLILVTDSKRDPQQGQCRKCGAPVGMDAPQLPLQAHTTAPPTQPHHHYQAISSTAPTLQRAVQVQHAPPTERQGEPQLVAQPRALPPSQKGGTVPFEDVVPRFTILNYTLLDLPYDIAAALHTFKSAADVPNTFRNRTVLWLNRDISQYTLTLGICMVKQLVYWCCVMASSVTLLDMTRAAGTSIQSEVREEKNTQHRRRQGPQDEVR